MAEPQDRAEDQALWRRWRLAAGQHAPVEPDPLLLAAYAENRLDSASTDLVEEWLAAHPEAVDDIRAARRAAKAALPQSPPEVVARAAAVVRHGDTQVLAFRRPVPRWRVVATWGCMAASLMIASVVGFSLGNDVYLNLAGGSSASVGQELLDPSGFLNGSEEDSAI